MGFFVYLISIFRILDIQVLAYSPFYLLNVKDAFQLLHFSILVVVVKDDIGVSDSILIMFMTDYDNLHFWLKVYEI